jgi:CdiI N-terminal domain
MSGGDARHQRRPMFDLELTGAPEGEGDRLFIWGRLTFGHFRDDFQAPLYDWAPGDYVEHWRDAATRLVEGAEVAVFLTHMMHPTAEYHLGWPAWREGETVYVQERLFVTAELTEPFDPLHPEVHAGPRRERTPDGQRIAQWQVGVSDVADFLRRQSRGRSSA